MHISSFILALFIKYPRHKKNKNKTKKNQGHLEIIETQIKGQLQR